MRMDRTSVTPGGPRSPASTRQTERMSRLVGTCGLARLDEGRETKLETVDLTELLVRWPASDMRAAQP